MKNYLVAALVFCILIMAIPCVSLLSSSAETDTAAVQSNNVTPDENSYLMLNISTGLVEKIEIREYIVGSVCAQMPATFETEALKAQAVAAHTYAERQKLKEEQNPTAELCGAYFSNDTSKYQAYFTKQQAMQYYGESFDTNYQKICNAVDAVINYTVTYNDEPIIAAFHSISTGMTESALNAWGSEIPYLLSVESEYDTAAPLYLEEYTFTINEIKQKLLEAYPDAGECGDDFSAWFNVTATSDAKTVTELKVGETTITGADFQKLFELRSAAFEITVSETEIKIVTMGNGHGVGMSQYGANEMAKEGKTFEDILTHYYSGVEISEK